MRPKAAFTLIELLTSIGIIGLLLGILLPAVGTARRTARDTQCASNIRQIGAALIGYAAHHNSFPPNSGESKQFWYQAALIGPYVSAPQTLSDGTLAGGVFRCPNDADDSIRSYSMNLYASGAVSSPIRKIMDRRPATHGDLFKFGTKDSSSLILAIESWSELPQPEAQPVGYAAQAVVGFAGKPGKRFGAGGGIGWTDVPGSTPGRFQTRASQVAYYRHAVRPSRRVEDPYGRVNVAFADGHIAMVQHDELANPATGKSSYIALWSLLDREVE